MKYTFLGFGLIMAGLIGIVFIVMFESITVNNESEYYVLKEAMEASMFESIDKSYYRVNGEVKIIEQKFVENFTRRFVASISGDATKYEIQFRDIIEKPPKATVVIRATTQEYSLNPKEEGQSFTIVNNLSGILELVENK